MPETYIVEQGDYLAKIADKFGFSSYKTIWDDPANAELKKKRKSPNILYPGDKIVIPDKEEKIDSASSGKKSTYEVKSDNLKLRLVVKDADGYPVANEPCELEITPNTYKKTTKADGLVEEKIPPTASEGMLRIRELEMPLKIGHLDPVEELSGQHQRLSNLGYDPGPPVELSYKRVSAVEEFQCDNKLKVDGICGPKTQAKLIDVHGC